MITNFFFAFLLSVSLQAQVQFSGRVGAECTEQYVPGIMQKNVAIVANQTSIMDGIHLVDTLLSLGVPVQKIFSPEHGFRGNNSAGAFVDNEIDSITQLPIISLYGNHKKPTKEDLHGIDVVIFDIQDVGARFYTYISTLHYVMEACAEQNISCLILDRPNPNGFYVAGPVLEPEFTSFVGMHPVPIVHGMTIGEYARMINGEGWLKNSVSCSLAIIPCRGYSHTQRYILPVAPSPNLPTMQSIYLYPTLCLFEGTVMSCGRGTDFPFEVIGAPAYNKRDFSFVPRSIPGASEHPRYEGETCYGLDFRTYHTDSVAAHGLLLDILIRAYTHYPDKDAFFSLFFYKLSGTRKVRHALEQNLSEEEMRELWQKDVERFCAKRKKYLLYPDFK
ncbi:MAG: DUF1343 domain-containing protein [Bacteroidales bacterium]|nr:DUF1343 domain-containing protein [Bacteroidales bacterium]